MEKQVQNLLGEIITTGKNIKERHNIPSPIKIIIEKVVYDLSTSKLSPIFFNTISLQFVIFDSITAPTPEV